MRGEETHSRISEGRSMDPCGLRPTAVRSPPFQRLQMATLALHDAEVETQGEDVKQKWSEEEKTRETKILTAKLECGARAACLCNE